MLGVGWTEMLVIGVVALIVIGPKELPGLMQKIGRFAGTVRRMGQDFQRELNKTTGFEEVKNLRTAITQPLKTTTDAIRKEFNTIGTNGTVQPSGALKPADPKAESVVKEIHAAAGIKAAEPVVKAAEPVVRAAEPIKGAPVKAAVVTAAAPATAAPAPAIDLAPPVKTARVKAAPVPKATPAPTSPVTTSDLFAPEQPKPARKPRKPKAVDSPAPVEAIAPAETAAKPKAPRKRKPAAKKA